MRLQGFVQQLQQEDSTSDSDICNNGSSEDSDIPDEHIDDQCAPTSFSTASLTIPLRRPTLVQHAAAATIQRRFRQHIHFPSKQDITQTCRQSLESSNGLRRLAFQDHDKQQQHRAALCIQIWWRHCMAWRRQMAVLTPPCSSDKAQMQNSRPDSTASSNLSGMHTM